MSIYFLFNLRGHNLDPKTVIAVAVLVCATLLWMLIGHIQQFTLRKLLSYRAFLYEPRGYGYCGNNNVINYCVCCLFLAHINNSHFLFLSCLTK